MSIPPALVSSQREVYGTPRWLFKELTREFAFDVDVCALPDNALCKRYFTPEDDGLAQPWEGTCWCNPPYGPRSTGAWVRKAYEESQRGATVVCLIPANTDTTWWHDYCTKGEIRFLRGRVRFEGGPTSAPFASAIVIFRPVVKKPGTVTALSQRCHACGRRWTRPRRADARYCSPACRQRAYRTRGGPHA